MIIVKKKNNCCGCETCVQLCPRQCISLVEDEEGFLYPNVDTDICVKCGVCEKACPVLNQGVPQHPLYAYAAINRDEDIRSKSSSGGVFSIIAEKIVIEGGVVFGARFNDKWEVEHGYTETYEGLHDFRGSKYVQSRIGETFIIAESFLKQGRKVLYSGTPCQIAGLYNFLRKPYDNLLTIDIVCHGVTSPKIWREYLSTLFPLKDILSISMKDKTVSWRGYNLTIKTKDCTMSERASKNKFMLAFSQNLSLRPSCYYCPAKAGKSCSDITLADYWGIEKILPQMDDGLGTSFVCANTEKGNSYLNTPAIKLFQVNYGDSVPFNPCIERSTIEPVARSVFWESYKRNGISSLNSLKPQKENIFKRILRKIIKMQV